MNKQQHPVLALVLVASTACLGVGFLGCKAEPSNQVAPQKTGEGPNDPNVGTDESGKKKKVVVDEDPEPNPDGIDLKPVGGQGGGPPDQNATPDAKPGTATPTAPPVTKKPTVTPKPKTTATPTPSSSAPPTWTPPPLPSGWTWPFPNTNPPPQGSTTPPPPNGGKTDAGTDAGPGTGGWTLPPFGGS